MTPECVHQPLEMVFDINVIEDQFEKLSDSVLGQCVQQVHVETDANTLRTVTCNYVYGNRVAADRVQPGTSIPTVSYNTLENKMKLHDRLQIKAKVKKELIQQLSGIHDELLKVGDITDVKNTNASKQNTLNNYYEHLEYQNEMKNEGDERRTLLPTDGTDVGSSTAAIRSAVVLERLQGTVSDDATENPPGRQ